MARSQKTNAAKHSYLPNQDTLDVVSLRYRTLVTDLIWLRALQLRGTKLEVSLIEQYGRAMIHMDPEFKPAYRWSSMNSLFSPGRITGKSIEKANWFLEQGMKHFPNDAFYPYTMGVHWAFYYPAKTDEERSTKKDRAVHYLQLALQRTNPPQGTVLLIASILKDDNDLRLDFLEQAYLSESNPRTRRSLEASLRHVAGSERRLSVERKRRQRENWLDRGFDYLDYGLAYHIGERMPFLPATSQNTNAAQLDE